MRTISIAQWGSTYNLRMILSLNSDCDQIHCAIVQGSKTYFIGLLRHEWRYGEAIYKNRGMFEIKSPETLQVQEKMISTSEQMQVFLRVLTGDTILIWYSELWLLYFRKYWNFCNCASARTRQIIRCQVTASHHWSTAKKAKHFRKWEGFTKPTETSYYFSVLFF